MQDLLLMLVGVDRLLATPPSDSVAEPHCRLARLDTLHGTE